MENSAVCLLIRLTGHTSPVRSVVFSPNGDYLASGSEDYTIVVWRVSSGERITTLKGHKK